MSATHTVPANTGGPVGERQRADGPVSWLRDLVLGVRLAVGGGRTSWSRLVLGTIGIGLAVGILLIAASVPTMLDQRAARELGRSPVTTAQPGVSPLYEVGTSSEFRNLTIQGAYVHATGANSPVPPGVAKLPGTNEIVLSPALRALLDSPDGAILRPRFPEKVIGTIAEAGLQQPSELTFFAGAGPELAQAQSLQKVYGFGVAAPTQPLDPFLVAIVVVGGVVLLLPIMLFIGVSSRIAGAQRDRRLAALRLVGAGSFQTRRIAAAESLVSAATGLVLGTLLFLVVEQVADGVRLLNLSVFSDDVVPAWPLAVLVVLLVPVIAVGSALLAMRRTVIEPLGVVRDSRPVRRTLWWRLTLVVIGTGLLLTLSSQETQDTGWTVQLAVGASALLIGVPAMLPWVLERAVSLFRGGRPSWQLAVRRLQLDSGTPARVVGGVAVVLAGAIALQTILLGEYVRYQLDEGGQGITTTAPGQALGVVSVQSDGGLTDQVSAALRSTPEVHQVYSYYNVNVVLPPSAADGGGPAFDQISVVNCQVIEQWIGTSDCQDGDAFRARYKQVGSFVAAPIPMPIAAGSRLSIVRSEYVDSPQAIGAWTVPAHLRPLALDPARVQGLVGDLVVTPGAFRDAVPVTALQAQYVAQVTRDVNSVEYIRNSLGPFTWHAQSSALFTLPGLSSTQQDLVTIRQGLIIGSLFTLLLAGASLLVLALEQIRERRRPLAALAATGVPRAMLARSLLWQTAVPVVIGVVLSIGAGLALAALVARFTAAPMVFDWADIGIFSGAAVGLVLLVTALTLPALRSATRLTALRTE